MSNNTPNDNKDINLNKPEPWYSGLSRYHWFVFIVCCLGWGMDTFDQQIFNLKRIPALADLMNLDTTHPDVLTMGAYATTIMLLGWGVGGILFGIWADKYGRARMMILTIFVYAIFTGLSGLATCWWDFYIYRFFCGMGVGGQFAAGVTLLSETLPGKARPKALGYLQMTGALCNVLAATLALICGIMEGFGWFQDFPSWRFLFLVGFLPALVAFAVMRHLKEPESWKEAIAKGGVKKAGSIADLFSHPRWRYNVIIGMLLATCGIIGLWGIGFFSVDLTRTAFRNERNIQARALGEVENKDFELARMLASNPGKYLPIIAERRITPLSFIGSAPGVNEAGAIFMLIRDDNNFNVETLRESLENAETPENRESLATILAVLERPQAERTADTVLATFNELWDYQVDRVSWRSAKRNLEADRVARLQMLEPMLRAEGVTQEVIDRAAFEILADSVEARASSITSYVTIWASITSILFNLGAIIGTWVIVVMAQAWGRRMALTVFFAASFFMTIYVFSYMGTGTTLLGSTMAAVLPMFGNAEWEVLILTPILGFCILSLFGGYAVYFPELFPTRLRSTGISFCYNIARFAAALGPLTLGTMAAFIFAAWETPIRPAGAAMAVTFIFGIIFAWMGPETKGQPLPEED